MLLVCKRWSDHVFVQVVCSSHQPDNENRSVEGATYDLIVELVKEATLQTVQAALMLMTIEGWG